LEQFYLRGRDKTARLAQELQSYTDGGGSTNGKHTKTQPQMDRSAKPP